MKPVKNNIKRVVKFSAKIARKSLKKNKFIRTSFVSIRNTIYPDLFNQQEVYNYRIYYPSADDYYDQLNEIKNFEYKPLISVVMPTYNTPLVFLQDCINSVIKQSYSNWELCIADDASPDKEVVELIKKYAKQDKRIKYVARETNGHISVTTNAAIELASGEFISLLDHDDILWPNALYEVVKTLNQNKKLDLIYTDEDKINTSGDTHSYPFLKPDWSPEFLESCNYITHFSTIRATLLKRIGALRKGYEGAQDWDLFIRIGEVTNKIAHIPKILYSWRVHDGSTASDTDAKPYVYEAQKKLLVDHISRQSKKGVVEVGIIKQHRTVIYQLKPKSHLNVVINIENINDIDKLLTSFEDFPAGAPFEVYLTKTKHIFDNHKKMTIKNISIDKLKRSIKGDAVLVVNSPVVFRKKDWALHVMSNLQIEGVGFVFPVLLDKRAKNILSAGYGIGFEDGVVNLLADTPFDDNHYTRGLYARSRRNVSSGNEAVYGITAEQFFDVDYSNEQDKFISFSLAAVKKGVRCVYTPHVQVIYNGKLTDPQLETEEVMALDPYLNPHFVKDSARMEVKSW